MYLETTLSRKRSKYILILFDRWLLYLSKKMVIVEPRLFLSSKTVQLKSKISVTVSSLCVG